jgi:hypothetical protein
MAHLVVAIVIALIGIAGGFLKLANARDRVRADLPSPVRVTLPLHWCLVLLLLVEAGAAFVLYTVRFHGPSKDEIIWFIFAVNAAAILAISFRLFMRRPVIVDELTRKEYRNGYSMLIGMAGTFVGACVSSFLITGHWFYPPKTSPADIRYIVGFAAVSCAICVYGSKKLFQRGWEPRQ